MLSDDELRSSGFLRIASALHSYWEEQRDIVPRAAKVHSRLFDTLIALPLITVGKSINGGGHIEHLVPCVLIRDKVFEMYWEGKTVYDAARMIGRLLRVAHITRDEARRIDGPLGYKTSMPPGWDFDTGSIFARLDAGQVKLAPPATPAPTPENK